MAVTPPMSTSIAMPYIFLVTGTDIATVCAAVLTKVKSLNTQLTSPVSGQTAVVLGVTEGTIVVDPVVVIANAQGTPVYTVSIRWQQITVPA